MTPVSRSWIFEDVEIHVMAPRQTPECGCPEGKGVGGHQVELVEPGDGEIDEYAIYVEKEECEKVVPKERRKNAGDY
ncbi:unnamed protein product [Gordionus sp. m RMFG-2023]